MLGKNADRRPATGDTATGEAHDGIPARKYAAQIGPPVYLFSPALPGIIAALLSPDLAAECLTIFSGGGYRFSRR